MSEKKHSNPAISRRSFLKSSALASTAAVVAPTILTGCTTINEGVVTRSTRPSGKIHMASIGIGWQGGSNLGQFLQHPDVQVVAVCDLDENHLKKAQKTVERTYDNFKCAAYSDFREMFEKEDLDAVVISLPDHWHAIPAIAAAEKGYDVFGEKPFSHTLVEGRAMVNALNKNGCIWQTGSWQRSVPNFHRAAELIRNGRIGNVSHVEIGLGRGHANYDEVKDLTTFGPPPKELDYDTWLGPAPDLPYCRARTHKTWRWIMAHGGGTLMDWVGHHGDIAHWGLGLDETGPVKVSGTGVIPTGQLWDSPTDYDCTLTYANGITMNISSKVGGGTKWFGSDGWIHVDRGRLDASDPKFLKGAIGENEIHLYKSKDHWNNFVEGIQTRKPTITPAETAHRSASMGHLCNIAMYTGRTINWDPNTETIKNDAGATDMLSPTYRKPWKLG